MTTQTVKDLLKTLLAQKVANYTASKNNHPEVAAQHAVEHIMSMYKNQPQYIEQLLTEEIEDAVKASKNINKY